MPPAKEPITTCLQVHVDTYEGLKTGVPKLLSIFNEFQIKASFFVAMGPDNSGKAIRRIFTKKGFLKKMLRTKAAKTYGLKTMLYGTLLPAPQISLSFPQIMQQIINDGHELGIHGYDHVKWHDLLDKLSKERIDKEEISPAIKNYQQILGTFPESSAAPGWKVNTKNLSLQDKLTMIYHSDCRGTHPFFPKIKDTLFNHLQIPTTLPTLDEIIGQEDVVPFITRQILNDKEKNLHIFTIHAEIEGMNYAELFVDILTNLKNNNVQFKTLRNIADNLLKNKAVIPVCEIINQELPGRAGAVAIQK